jgi:hypothetical protein
VFWGYANLPICQLLGIGIFPVSLPNPEVNFFNDGLKFQAFSSNGYSFSAIFRT